MVRTQTSINEFLGRLETERHTQDEKFDKRLASLEHRVDQFGTTLEGLRVASDGHLQVLKKGQGIAKQQHQILERLTTRVAAEGGASSFVTLDDINHLRDGLAASNADAFETRMETVMQRLKEMEDRILYEDVPSTPVNPTSISVQTSPDAIPDEEVPQPNQLVQTPISPTLPSVEAAENASIIIPPVPSHPEDAQTAVSKTHESHADLDKTSTSLPHDPVVDQSGLATPAVCERDSTYKEILTCYNAY